MPRRAVPQARDLGLVGHDPDQRQPVAREDLAGERGRLRGSVQRRALGAHAHATAERPPAGVDVDAHAHRRAPRCSPRALDQLQLLDAVDHHRHARTLLAGSAAACQPAQRVFIRARVGDEDVPCPVRGQPQRLREREGERPREARAGQHALLQGAAAHRLARQADRLRRGPPLHVGRVGRHRVQVHERERRLQARARALQARIRSLRAGRRGGGAGRSAARTLRAREHVGGHAGTSATLGPSTRSVQELAKRPLGSRRARTV